MDELLEWMDYIEDKRQQTKVRHKLKDIIVIVLFATLANVDDWVEMEYFAHYHEAYLKKYIELKNCNRGKHSPIDRTGCTPYQSIG